MSESVAIFVYPIYQLRYEVFPIFGGRHIGFFTSAHIAQYSYCYIWVSHLRNTGKALVISILSHLQAELWRISGLTASILDVWLPHTSHSVRIAIFEFLILENKGMAVGILILSQLLAEICGSSGLSAIFDLWLPVCQETDIRSARWDICSNKSLDTRTVDFCPISVSYVSLKRYQTCHSIGSKFYFVHLILSPCQSATEDHMIMFTYSFCRELRTKSENSWL